MQGGALGSAPAEAEEVQEPGGSSLPTFRHRPKVIFVLGGPGAGKGTQCERIVERYGFIHLSAGNLLREERASGSPDGELIDQIIKEGKIVPVAITLRLLKRAMLKSKGEIFLIDGFPRNYDNLQGWERAMGGDVDVEAVLFYDVPQDEMEMRLLARGKTSGRTDDNIDSIRKRFKTFAEATMPIVNHYEEQNKVIRITGTGSPDLVFKSTAKAVEPLLEKHLVEITQRLLDAIHSGDWETYEELVDPSLTAFEPEAVGHIVEGLKFHEFYFKHSGRGNAGATMSTITDPRVRLLNHAAIVTYVRLVQHENDGKFHTSSYEETRVWEQQSDGSWKHSHFHRSKPPAS